MIHLEKIDAGNVYDITGLEVAAAQKDFVAANKDSIVEAYTTIGTECKAFPFGIYDDKTLVGFLMIGFNLAAMYEYENDLTAPEAFKNTYTIWRLMIDERYQNKGYGKEAVRLALDFIRTWPEGKAEYCAVSYEPENITAAGLYHSFGFIENGEMDDDEIVAVLKL